ncbi:hypothetical protein O1611_g2513 [Lasiodiplodia mahajangana]|uniref:Uncharacterized protein n=1 Tax=Lasiodiplodia mahajangana TaxID=1108764 RepID=A0ACC2JV18_9PEZI|nr:hypothetical protein O1611_g2513 [Lasiodiplodia mahajangana]
MKGLQPPASQFHDAITVSRSWLGADPRAWIIRRLHVGSTDQSLSKEPAYTSHSPISSALPLSLLASSSSPVLYCRKMVFTPPAWVPQLPFDPPDSIPLHEFLGNERYGRLPFDKSQNPFTCGLTGKTYTHAEMRERQELLARSLSKRMGWRPNEDTPWDKVIGLYSLNTIDYLTSTYAVHRLSGIVTPANAMYSAAELEHQLKSSGAKALFTCPSLLDNALKAARASNIPDDKVFTLDVPGQSRDSQFKTIDELIDEGGSLPELESLRWTKGQGARQVAYLCYSSGTSGLPKAVMIAHRNVIANIMQIRWHEDAGRRQKSIETQTQIGLLPLSHIYGLVVIASTGPYRGDSTIILPRFELRTLLQSIQRFKINYMHLDSGPANHNPAPPQHPALLGI